MTHEDICNAFRGDTLLAVLAPAGTMLEVASPEMVCLAKLRGFSVCVHEFFHCQNSLCGLNKHFYMWLYCFRLCSDTDVIALNIKWNWHQHAANDTGFPTRLISAINSESESPKTFCKIEKAQWFAAALYNFIPRLWKFANFIRVLIWTECPKKKRLCLVFTWLPHNKFVAIFILVTFFNLDYSDSRLKNDI